MIVAAKSEFGRFEVGKLDGNTLMAGDEDREPDCKVIPLDWTYIWVEEVGVWFGIDADREDECTGGTLLGCGMTWQAISARPMRRKVMKSRRKRTGVLVAQGLKYPGHTLKSTLKSSEGKRWPRLTIV
jgi:hypothetical protein